MSTGYLNEKMGYRVILDHLFPRLESITDENIIVPLLYSNRLYYLPALIHLAGCRNENCRACTQRRNTAPPANQVVEIMCTHNFDDACKIASNVITSANYNSARSHSGGSTEQKVRLLTHNDRPSGTNQSLYGHNNSREDSDLLQAAQRLERRDEMRRQGVNPPPHRMRDRHHLRIRRIDHQTADDTFGHYGANYHPK